MSEKNKSIDLYSLAEIRKTNAVVSIICTILLIAHGLYEALWMYNRGKLPMFPEMISFLLMGLVFIHIALSIFCLAIRR